MQYTVSAEGVDYVEFEEAQEDCGCSPILRHVVLAQFDSVIFSVLRCYPGSVTDYDCRMLGLSGKAESTLLLLPTNADQCRHSVATYNTTECNGNNMETKLCSTNLPDDRLAFQFA